MYGRFSIIGGTCPGCPPKSTFMLMRSKLQVAVDTAVTTYVMSASNRHECTCMYTAFAEFEHISRLYLSRCARLKLREVVDFCRRTINCQLGTFYFGTSPYSSEVKVNRASYKCHRTTLERSLNSIPLLVY